MTLLKIGRLSLEWSGERRSILHRSYMEKMIIRNTVPFHNDPNSLNRIPAIKWYREYIKGYTGNMPSLIESKTLVEAVLTKHSIPWSRVAK